MPNSICAALLLLSGLWQTPEPFQISVKVDLVALHTTVHDRKGKLVSDLEKQHFSVFEDGVRQTIRVFQHEDSPVTVGLVIDHSGSMRQKLPDVIAAARKFVESSRPEDEIFVVNFNERITLGLPAPILFSDRQDELALAISSTPAQGQTALYDAILKALDQLKAGSREKKVLIIISDGGDNRSTHSMADVLRKAQESNAMVYTVGIFDEEDPDWDPRALRILARATGGEAYFSHRPDGAVAECERIAHDIRHQYAIGYVSSQAAQPGIFRGIRVTAAGTAGSGPLIVRARSGYFTPRGNAK